MALFKSLEKFSAAPARLAFEDWLYRNHPDERIGSIGLLKTNSMVGCVPVVEPLSGLTLTT